MSFSVWFVYCTVLYRTSYEYCTIYRISTVLYSTGQYCTDDEHCKLNYLYSYYGTVQSTVVATRTRTSCSYQYAGLPAYQLDYLVPVRWISSFFCIKLVFRITETCKSQKAYVLN